MNDQVIIYKRFDADGVAICHPTDESLADKLVYKNIDGSYVYACPLLEVWMQKILGNAFIDVVQSVPALVEMLVPTYRQFMVNDETAQEALVRFGVEDLDAKLEWEIVPGLTIEQVALNDVPKYRNYMLDGETEEEALARFDVDSLDENLPYKIISKANVPSGRSMRDAWDINDLAVEISPLKIQDVIISRVTAQIKSEAARRINLIAPDYKQRNMIAELMRHASDHFTLVEDSNSRDPSAPLPPMTEAHKDKFSEYGDIQEQIDYIRSKSNLLEDSLENMTINELQELDITNDVHWS